MARDTHLGAQASHSRILRLQVQSEHAFVSFLPFGNSIVARTGSPFVPILGTHSAIVPFPTAPSTVDLAQRLLIVIHLRLVASKFSEPSVHSGLA